MRFILVLACAGCTVHAQHDPRDLSQLDFAVEVPDLAAIITPCSMPAAHPMMDTLVDGSTYPTMQVAGSDVVGVGVDVEQNVWSVHQGSAVATRILVDGSGTITPPDLASPPQGTNKCPAGDRCVYEYHSPLGVDPQGDLTGFGRSRLPTASYSYVVAGCGEPNSTRWVAASWDALVPAGTSIAMRARTGTTGSSDGVWYPWSSLLTTSPGVLLKQYLGNDDYLQVEFQLVTTNAMVTPSLKGFRISFECVL